MMASSSSSASCACSRVASSRSLRITNFSRRYRSSSTSRRTWRGEGLSGKALQCIHGTEWELPPSPVLRTLARLSFSRLIMPGPGEEAALPKHCRKEGHRGSCAGSEAERQQLLLPSGDCPPGKRRGLSGVVREKEQRPLGGAEPHCITAGLGRAERWSLEGTKDAERDAEGPAATPCVAQPGRSLPSGLPSMLPSLPPQAEARRQRLLQALGSRTCPDKDGSGSWVGVVGSEQQCCRA